MALYAAAATGNFGTAATWNRATTISSISTSATRTVDTTGDFTTAFTAPNTTNKAVGVLVYYTGTNGATTLTATLQESTVDTACTATITLADVDVNTWIYFVPATPYTFTTTAASAYRWKLTTDTSTATVSQTNAVGAPAAISIDDRTGTPVSGDSAYIIAHNGTSTSIVITMNGTQTVGQNSNPASSRSVSATIIVGKNCQMQMDTTATSELTIRGHCFIESGGEWSCGTTASPLSSSYTATVKTSTNNAALYYATGAKGIWQGSPKTYQRTTIVSGDGSSGDPLITADAVDWSVGDRIIAAPVTDSATNYNESEVRYIRTKNSSTSYTLAATSGGAESAFTYSHDGALLGNFENNVVIRGNSPSVYIGLVASAQATTGMIDIDWVRFENLSDSTFLGAVPIRNIVMTQNCEIDNCVALNGPAGLFYFSTLSDQTFTNLMTYNTATTVALAPAFADIAQYSCTRVTLQNCYSFSSNCYGIGLDTSFSSTIEDCSAYASTNSTASAAGIGLTNSGKNQFTNVVSSANRVNGLYYYSGSANTFTNCNFGLGATNQVNDIYMGAGFCNALFEDCTFEASNLIDNYLNMIAGSEIRFSRYQDTDNQHRWYDVYGHGISEATVIRSPGLSVKLVPENTTDGFTWSFKVPVVQNSIAGFRGYFLKNATLGSSVVTISMYLPGNSVGGGVPDNSVTLDNTTGSTFSDANEQSVAMTSTYTGDIPGAMTVTVNIKSNTAGAALYCDDFFNAGDRTTTFDSITGLNVWSDGKPLEVISPSVSSADDIAEAVKTAVWGDTTTYSAGTKADVLQAAADDAELAAIK